VTGGQNLQVSRTALIDPQFTLLDTTDFSLQFSPDLITTTTPVPATLPLFATDLGAIGLLGWRKKRKGQAVA
jgi:hypothetical protein